MSAPDLPGTIVNGRRAEVPRDARRLIDWLRDDLGLRAPKEGCSAGHCGACTVVVDGHPGLSCSLLAVWSEGSEILLADQIIETDLGSVLAGELVARGGVQCGFCSPGMVSAAYAFLISADLSSVDAGQVRRALAGNVCRCTGYQPIVEAVLAAARRFATK